MLQVGIRTKKITPQTTYHITESTYRLPFNTKWLYNSSLLHWFPTWWDFNKHLKVGSYFQCKWVCRFYRLVTMVTYVWQQFLHHYHLSKGHREYGLTIFTFFGYVPTYVPSRKKNYQTLSQCCLLPINKLFLKVSQFLIIVVLDVY